MRSFSNFENMTHLLELIRQHLAWYPRMQVRDVYKLIYQGAMGPEHMVATQQEFARRLEAEFTVIPAAPQERLLEAVRADQSLLRLNLRPYKARQPIAEGLVPFLLETSRQTHGSMEALVKDWAIFIELCAEGQASPFEINEARRFSKWLEMENYPPVHHSQAYRREYQPSYRLSAAQLAENLGLVHAG